MTDLEGRVTRLVAFEESFPSEAINFGQHLDDPAELDRYFAKLQAILELMRDAQTMAADIQRKLNNSVFR